MNKAGMVIGAVALATLGILAGKSQAAKINEEIKPLLNNECTLIEPLRADEFIKRSIKKLSKSGI